MKTIFIFLLAMLHTICVQADDNPGSGFSLARQVGIHASDFLYTNTTATSDYTLYNRYCWSEDDLYDYNPDYPNVWSRCTEGNAVYYEFTLEQPSDVQISTADSEIFPVISLTQYVVVYPGSSERVPRIIALRSPGETSKDGLVYASPDVSIVSQKDGMLLNQLEPGRYCVIAGGLKLTNGCPVNGLLKMTIQGTVRYAPPIDPGELPEEENGSPVKYNYDLSGNRTERLALGAKAAYARSLLTGMPTEAEASAGTRTVAETSAAMRTVNTTKDVGEIQMESSTTPSGSVVYTIPIGMYSDPDECQPSLSLVYNSQAAESAAGYGWSLGGVSSLSHTSASVYYDGAAAPLSCSGDVFTLDGMRLIKTATNQWETEQQNIKVSKTGARSFEARYPNGSVYLYESDRDGVISYPLTLITDLKGNTVKYTYEFAGNQYYPVRIEYGHNGNGGYAASLVLTYETVTDALTKYIDGKPVVLSRLLKKIDSYYQTDLLRTYQLTHVKKETTFLTQIDCAAKGKSLNPLKFTYGADRSIEYFNEAKTYLLSSFQNKVQGDKGYDNLMLYRGRFSRNAQNDGLIAYPAWATYAWVGRTDNDHDIWGSKYGADQDLLVYKELKTSDFIDPVVLKAEEGFQDLSAVDMNGDGVDELVKINYYKQPQLLRSTMALDIKIYNSSLTAYETYSMKFTDLWREDGYSIPRNRRFMWGDFNGDGKTELLIVSGYRSPSRKGDPEDSQALLLDLDEKRELYRGHAFPYTYFQEVAEDNSPDILIPMDYNGDGKAEVCLLNKQGLHVYEFDGRDFNKVAFMSMANYHLGSSTFNFNDCEMLLGDVNGDGNMDIVLTPKKSNINSSGEITRDNGCIWKFFLSTANSEYTSGDSGFNYSEQEFIYHFYEQTGYSHTSNYTLMDMDNDGLSDLVVNRLGKINLYLNKNGVFNTEPEMRVNMQNGANSQLTFANVSQSYFWSGSLVCVDNADIHIYSYTRKEKQERMLRKAVNSYGVETQHSYVDLLNSPRLEMPYSAISYPYVRLRTHLYAPISTESFVNGSKVSSFDYNYANPVFHLQGMGFRGFEKITVTDNLRNRTSVQTYDPRLFGSLVNEETATMNHAYTYQAEIGLNKIAKVRLMKKVQQDKLNGTEAVSEYTYDTYGNPLTEVITNGLHNKVSKANTFLNVDNASRYLIGLPVQQIVSKERYDSLIVEKSTVQYNADYLPSVRKQFIEGNLVSEETLLYTGKRLTSSTQKGYTSPVSSTTTYEYDAQGRLIKKTNPMGNYTTYVYQPATGLIAYTEDQKGRRVSYTYDAWGDLQSTLYPDGRVESKQLDWASTPASALYTVTTTATGTPTAKVYYDALGREVRNSEIRFDGKEMKTDKEYDSKGMLIRTSQPTTATPSLWITYTYDEYDRPLTVTHPSGKKEVNSYDKLQSTLVKDGIKTTKHFDEAGYMTSVSDTAGSIRYFYRPDGQPYAVVAPGEAKTWLYYDKYGRRTGMKDPSAGIRHTVYDEAGNVKKEIDATGKTIEMEYDNYHRVTKQITPDLTTTYTYDNSENVLVSAVSTNATAKRYTYDALGRLATEKEEAPDGKWLLKTYQYDANGLMASLAYSSQSGSLATEQYTYQNNHLTTVKLADGTIVRRLNTENSLGQPINLTTGTATRTYGYNAYGIPTERALKRSNGTMGMQQMYNFDMQRGNLLSRTDKVRNLTENFSYDALNRLTGYKNETVGYAPNGNILSKSDAGILVYTNPNRPYAVTGITSETGAVPMRGQVVTYTAAQRPATISENGYVANLIYNANHDRVRMELTHNGTNELTRYYLGDCYEWDHKLNTSTEKLYLGGNYYSAPAVLIKQNGTFAVRYIVRDYLGSILQLTDASGNVIEENSYDAWGRRRDPATQTVYALGSEPELMLGRGYTGHEHLPAFGLVNMNARLYDPVLGRFLSPDPYVQMPDFSQNFNRFSYCLNNPLAYVDEDGEFFFSLFLGPIGVVIDGACWGAVIGAAASATTYTLATLVSGQPWNSGNFWNSVGVGAVGGALGGATGSLGDLSFMGSFGNTVGYNMLSGIANTVTTNVVFDHDTSWSDILSVIGSSAIGSAIPTFKGLNSSKFLNGLAEIGYNTMRGAASGLASGMVNAAMHHDPDRIWQGVLGGAISGAGRSIAMNVIFGAPYKADKSYGAEGLYRGGGIADIIEWGLGLTMGKNMYVNDKKGGDPIRYHENRHVQQQNQMGWSRFYGRTIYEYIKYGFNASYSTEGTLENDADQYEIKMMKY